jgi:hypothetical protein
LVAQLTERAAEISSLKDELPRAEARLEAARAPIADREAALAACCNRDNLDNHIRAVEEAWSRAKLALAGTRGLVLHRLIPGNWCVGKDVQESSPRSAE